MWLLFLLTNCAQLTSDNAIPTNINLSITTPTFLKFPHLVTPTLLSPQQKNSVLPTVK